MIAPEDLLHDEDEGAEEDPSLSEDEKKELESMVKDFDHDHDEQNIEVALLAIAPPPAPQPQQHQPVDFPRCRTELNQLFAIRTDRVLAKAHGLPFWNMRGKESKLPRKGTDSHFDAKVHDLGLSKNRTYVAAQWLKYKRNRGIFPPPVFELKNVDDTKALIASLLVSVSVIAKAMALTKKHFVETSHNALKDLNGAIDYANSEVVQNYLGVEVERITTDLCDSVLLGAKATTIDARASESRMKYRTMWRQDFIRSVEAANPPDASMDRREMRLYLVRLHRFVREVWEEEVLEIFEVPMELYVLDDNMDELLSGSESLVYYVSGWLLDRLSRSKLRAVDSKTLVEFVRYNRQTSADAALAKAPTAEIDRREKKLDCMTRATHSWYSFVSLLEALYIVNTNACQAIQHRGKLLEAITLATRRSQPLRERFAQCFPPSFGKQQRKAMFRCYNVLLLSCYGKMKSGDTIRQLRNLSNSSGASVDKLPTRAKVAGKHDEVLNKKN
jgi:hypothetical protein